MNMRVLFVAVHPDDETLGCGGTILKHKANGNEIYWLIITDLDERFGKDMREKRTKETEQVAQHYEFDGVYNLKLPTMQVDELSMSELIGKISKVFQEVQPNIVYLPFKSDIHSDHRKVFEAAFACTKSFRYPYIKKIYMMETLSETEFAPNTKEDGFVPNVFVDISSFLDKKIE